MADVVNVSGAVGNLVDQAVPILVERVGFLISIFKAVGIVLFIYIVYLIILGIIKWKDRKRLKRVERKINEIDTKLDKLLGKKEIKKDVEKPDKKKGRKTSKKK